MRLRSRRLSRSRTASGRARASRRVRVNTSGKAASCGKDAVKEAKTARVNGTTTSKDQSLSSKCGKGKGDSQRPTVNENTKPRTGKSKDDEGVGDG